MVAGEPPLFLASSVFFALKDAVGAARADHGVTGFVKMYSPATVERVRMACRDDVAQLYTKDRKPPSEVEYRTCGSW